MLEFLIDNIFVSFGGTLSAGRRHTNGYELWYKSKNDADEALSVVSLTSRSGGYINGRNSANLELLINISVCEINGSSLMTQKGKTCYSEEQVISMLEFLIDNIFVSFGGTLI
jgi:hypothetical protein